MWLAVAILIGAVVAVELWRRRRAREIAERWLAQHNYRVRTLRPVYVSARPHFRATPFRNNDWAVEFRAEVDDMRLGGTGEVRLRVWTDLLGLMDREPEVSWDRMPTLADGGAPEGTIVVASAQTAGRGRLGRRWHSPPDAGLYVSLIVRGSGARAERCFAPIFERRRTRTKAIFPGLSSQLLAPL